MGNLLPAKLQPYIKAWASLIGVIVSAVTVAVPDVPTWVTIIGSIASTLAVYKFANGGFVPAADVAAKRDPKTGRFVSATAHTGAADGDEVTVKPTAT